MPDNITSLNANDLRAIAEAADAIRNTDACLVSVQDASGVGSLAVMTLLEAAQQNLTPIVVIRTNDVPALLQPRRTISVLAGQNVMIDGAPATSLNAFDAIFTSLSAVDKFVIPYYARFQTLAQCENIRNQFASDSNAVALLHLPESQPSVARRRSQLFIANDTGSAAAPQYKASAL